MGDQSTHAAAAALSDLFARLHALVHRDDPRFTAIGTTDDVVGPLTELALATRRTAWTLQRSLTLAGLRETHDLNEEMLRRGVTMRTLVSPRILERTCPLMSSYDTEVRLAPVPHPLLVADRRTLVVGNAVGDTLFSTSDAGLVADVVHVVDRVWQSSPRAVPVGTDPPFTSRMVEVAFLLVEGGTDASIAKALGVSQRTVSADVAEMTRRLGARSRAHAIARVSGNG